MSLGSDHRDVDVEVEVAVVGAGAAGLFAALTAAREGAGVTLISATPLAQAASYWAQGGLAAALDPEDSVEQHLADTVAAGRDAVRISAARVLCDEAPARVRDLQALGIRFDLDGDGALALGLEGGHSRRRVAHAGGSATGRRVSRELSAIVAQQPQVKVRERTRATQLWVEDGRCVGVVTDSGEAIGARTVILATGGTAALWSRTTNPPGSWGSGLLLAHRAGATLADLELMQFHPTAVADVEGIDGFLITEAIRGEGARLLNAEGERFVDELAPRDEVARAIETLLISTGANHVDLDMREVDPGKFPNVVRALRDAGIDPARELVPVAPAAHYLMGGIATDVDGRSDVPGLFAIGECACNGLHGANRLASNSLSECFVSGRRAALAAGQTPRPGPRGSGPVAVDAASAPTWETRTALWNKAGLARDADGLRSLLDDPHPLARLVATGALKREESRGAHRRTDFPERDPDLDSHHVLIAPNGSARLERWT